VGWAIYGKFAIILPYRHDLLQMGRVTKKYLEIRCLSVRKHSPHPGKKFIRNYAQTSAYEPAVEDNPVHRHKKGIKYEENSYVRDSRGRFCVCRYGRSS
jgi:hypothetical protein